MTFFPDQTSHPLDMEARAWADQLRAAVKKAGHLVKTESAGKRDQHWTDQFVLLRREMGAARVQKALEWYCNHLKDDYVPQAYSATSFRAKFSRIEQAMLSRTDEVPEPSQEDRARAERLLNECTFPPEIASLLSEVARRTREAWDDFLVKVSHVHTDTKNSRWRRFLEQVCVSHAPTFVDRWLVFLHNRYGNCVHYTGGVARLAFRPKSEEFKMSFWRRWSWEWCGQPEAFDDLLKEINK